MIRISSATTAEHILLGKDVKTDVLRIYERAIVYLVILFLMLEASSTVLGDTLLYELL